MDLIILLCFFTAIPLAFSEGRKEGYKRGYEDGYNDARMGIRRVE